MPMQLSVLSFLLISIISKNSTISNSDSSTSNICNSSRNSNRNSNSNSNSNGNNSNNSNELCAAGGCHRSSHKGAARC